MKAERRHELKENALAGQTTRVVKVMQLPEERRKWLGRGALILAVIALLAALLRSRANSSENARRAAAEHLAVAAEMIRSIKWQVPSANLPLATGYMEFVQKNAEAANSELDTVTSSTDDPKIVAQAAVLRGNLNFALANEPVIPAPTTASTQPVVTLKQSREQYLSQAANAYQEVVSKYADQPMSIISAQFGLAAIAENQQKWDDAAQHYQAIAMNPDASPAVKQVATAQREQLATLKQPALLDKGTSVPLIAATMPSVTPATTQATTQPVKTLATTRPSVSPAIVAPTTKPSTTATTKPK